MSLVRKMQEGAKTPTLYTMYGKQYDFDELQRSADQGLAEHLAGLKRGSKDETQFRDAYNNIMMGIRDGSITYQDGRFVDTKYGYHNSPDKDKNKDHYGLMANYIFEKMGRSPEYVKPEDKTKIKWNGAESVGLALRRALYNSDNENIAAFLDIDKNDLKNNKLRSEELLKRFLDIRSGFENLFTGYTPADMTSATGYLDDAIEALKDGSFDSGDYLRLIRAASGLDYGRMFASELTSPTQGNTEHAEQRTSTLPSQVELFLQFMDQYYPQHTFTEKGPLFDYTAASQILLTPEAQTAFNLVLSGMSDEQLQDLLRRYIRTSKEATPFQIKLGNTTTPISNAAAVAFILKYLKDNDKLSAYSFGESNFGAYYLPGSWTKGGNSGLVWDTSTGKVSEMDYLKIPYIRALIALEFNTWLQNRQNHGSSTGHWLDGYGFYKEGGILKAQHGIRFTNKANWYTGVFRAQLNTILEKLKSDPEYYKWLNDMLDKHYNIYTAAGGSSKGWLDTAYKSNDVEAYLNLYKRGKENEFAENTGGYNLYGINNSYNLGMFDRFGPYVRPSGDWNNKDAISSWKVDGMYSGVTDYRRLLGRLGDYTDDQLKEAEDTFRKAGYRFDLDPKTNYYKLEPLTEESPQDRKQVQPSPYEVDEPYDGSDFNEVTGGTEPLSGSTKITLTTGDRRNPSRIGQGFLNTLGELAPELVGAGRLALSLNTNNRVAKTIRPTLTPVLKNTYERFSPITGDLYTRQSGYKRAGDIQSRFSRPMTSDASLYAHTMLEANRQATALQSQVDAADNQEIKRTAAEALARVEDNMARRSETANFNRASMNLTNREIAQLEATRLKSNWLSWDNYLQGIEGRLRTKLQERDALRKSAMQASLSTLYSDAIAKLDALYREQNPNATTSTMLADSRYTDAVRALLRLHLYNSYNLSLNPREDPYKEYKSRSYEDILGSLTFSAKSGGLLKPSVAYLINKVIRNENNT